MNKVLGRLCANFRMEVVMQRLKGMLEEFDVCSANWRRTVESELSKLAGDEFVREKEEIEKCKEKNNQVRDKILMHIGNRRQTSTPESSGTITGSASGSMTGSTTASQLRMINEHL